MSQIRNLSALSVLFLSFSLSACQPPANVTFNNSEILSPLSAELDEATRLNLQSAQNSLLQARNTYFQVTAQLITVSTDVEAFRKVSANVLPPMLAAANSLSSAGESDDANRLKSEYQTLFNDIVTQMLNGINNNLRIYQGFIDAPQALDGQGPTSASTAVEDLTDLLVATESTEQFVTQLSQFQTLLTDVSNILNGIQNQQNQVINGTIKFANAIEDPAELIRAYQAVVVTLTRPQFFNQIRDLAIRAYGENNVATRRSEVSPTQPNPNLLNMVVRESETQYRFIREENGRLVNEVLTDGRGLSAADFLSQSNVVVVRQSE